VDYPESSADPTFTAASALLNETFTVYINSRLLAQLDALPSFSNPKFSNEGVPIAGSPWILDETSLVANPQTPVTREGYGDQTFYKYELKFNKSEDAINSWNLNPQVTVNSRIQLRIVNSIVTDEGLTFIHVDSKTPVRDTPYVTPGKYEPPTGSALLMKEQLDSSQAKAKFIDIVPARFYKDPGSLFHDLTPVTTDIVADEDYYTVFKILVNANGIEKMYAESESGQVTPGVLQEIVPYGLKILSVAEEGKTYYGFELNRKYGDPPLPYTTVEGKNGFFIDDNKSDTNDIRFTGGQNNVYNMPVLRYHDDDNDFYSAPRYGITSSFDTTASTTSGGGILNLQFGKPSVGQRDTNYDKNVEYTLYVIMVPDITITEEPVDSTNVVTMDYPERTTQEIADSTVTLTKGSGAAGLKKYVLGEQGYTTDFVVTLPGISGVINQPYRLVLTSDGSHATQDVNFSDRGDARYINLQNPEFKTSDVAINAYTGKPGPEGTIGTATPRTTAMAVTTLNPTNSAIKTGFSATNTAEIPQGSIFHTFDFTFKYENVPYGVAVKNTAIRSVYTVTPLKFAIEKIDPTSPKVDLTGWAFTAYYAQANDSAVADLGRPVLDINGDAVNITDTSATAYILPEGYTPKIPGTWNIVFVETQQPTGYPEAGNKGLQVPAVITSDAAGTLTVAPLPGDSPIGAGGVNASNVTFSAVTGIATVIAYNKPGTPDTPPDKPDTPTTPDTPGKPDAPVTPSGGTGNDVPTTPDTPNNPDVPVTPSGNTGDDSDSGDVPVTPSGNQGSSPATGDESVPGVMIALIALAIAGLLIVRRQLMKIK
jgi:hypothetical protein